MTHVVFVLTVVHVSEDVLEVLGRDIPQDNDGVGRGGRRPLEQRTEKIGTGGQDELVSSDLRSVTDEGHVHEVVLVPQLLECGHHGLMVVVPAQTKLLFRIPHFRLLASQGNFQIFFFSSKTHPV